MTAPYLAALATPYAESIRIYDLAVEPFELKGPVPDVALLTSTMAQFDQVFKIGEFLKAKGTRSSWEDPTQLLLSISTPE